MCYTALHPGWSPSGNPGGILGSFKDPEVWEVSPHLGLGTAGRGPPGPRDLRGPYLSVLNRPEKGDVPISRCFGNGRSGTRTRDLTVLN